MRTLAENPGLRETYGSASAVKARKEFDERDVVRIVVDAHRRAWETRVGVWPFDVPANEPKPVVIEAGSKADAAQIAWLHASGITTGFLSTLGVPFLERLYRFLAASPLGLLIVARNDAGEVVGYVAGTTSTSDLYRAFLRSAEGWSAAMIALGRALRPAVAKRIWETLRYGTESGSSGAELLSMVVSASARGQGLGLRLGRELLERFLEHSVDSATVVVGRDNESAIGLYRRLGFTDEKAIALHDDSPSLALTWSR
jgi:ribosomal protein S18 acetylase RimI-like enzyme